MMVCASWRGWCLALFLCGGVLVGPGAEVAQGQGLGDLMVSPKRVVFEGRQRSAQLVLVNQGTTTATYRIGFVHLRMTDDGELVEVETSDPSQSPAADWIHFSPRQVVLEPGISQSVRLLLRRPADLLPGEYRSHLRFAAVPTGEQTGTSIESTDPSGDTLAVQLIPVFGVTLPVIVRHGDLQATVAVQNLVLESPPGAPPVLSFQLGRRGDRSVYGDLTWVFEDATGVPTVLGALNGVAVYPPNPSRTVRLPLHLPAGVELDTGVLRVTYSARPDPARDLADTEPIVLAEGRLVLP